MKPESFRIVRAAIMAHLGPLGERGEEQKQEEEEGRMGNRVGDTEKNDQEGDE